MPAPSIPIFTSERSRKEVYFINIKGTFDGSPYSRFTRTHLFKPSRKKKKTGGAVTAQAADGASGITNPNSAGGGCRRRRLGVATSRMLYGSRNHNPQSLIPSPTSESTSRKHKMGGPHPAEEDGTRPHGKPGMGLNSPPNYSVLYSLLPPDAANSSSGESTRCLRP